jgi:hypothetical protein
VQGLIVRGPHTAIALGTPFRLHVTLDVGQERLAGRHCLRVEAIAPDGRPVRHYLQKVLTDRATTEVIVELALNDKVGTWRFRVTDVATGRTAFALIAVPSNRESSK